MRLNLGTKFILIYIFIYFVVAGVGYELIGYKSGLYNIVIWNKLSLIIFVILFFAALLVNTRKIKKHYYFDNFLSVEKQIIIIGVLDIITLLNYTAGNSNYRYSQEGMSENGGGLLFAFALVNTVLNFFLMVYIFYSGKFLYNKGIKPLLLRILFSIGLIFSINGNASTLLALLFFLSSFFPNIFRNIIFDTGKKSFGFNVGKLFFFLFLIPILLMANIYGESIKMGISLSYMMSEFALTDYLQGFLTYLFSYVLSPNYVSFKYAINHFAFSLNIDYFFENIMLPLKNCVYRLDTLIGHFFGCIKPQVGSLSKRNYELITEIAVQNAREGTAPGFFATFFICFPFPLNFLFFYLGLSSLKKYLNILLKAMPYKISGIGMIIFLYFFIFPILASPMDYLLIIDNSAVYFLCVILFLKFSIKTVNATN